MKWIYRTPYAVHGAYYDHYVIFGMILVLNIPYVLLPVMTVMLLVPIAKLAYWQVELVAYIHIVEHLESRRHNDSCR